MNTYVVMSWSPRVGMKCVGLNMNQRSAENMAVRAVKDFIRFTGCGGAVAENDDHTEFCAENASKEFKVKIDVVKVYLNFANR